ncbi:hypothetical protein [Actinomadura litoris]|uniref:hypothetical protein n=1 Tax=Actinomadura litoris TaxID=2678616 RepID=UPI001567BA25|nr:hypothetical protein [Actinomadura litoris]
MPHTGSRWKFLPQEPGFAVGNDVQAEWHQAGAWDALHRLLLEGLHAAEGPAWTRR